MMCIGKGSKKGVRGTGGRARMDGRNKPRYSTLPGIPVSRGIFISENPRGNIFALIRIIGHNSEKKVVGF